MPGEAVVGDTGVSRRGGGEHAKGVIAGVAAADEVAVHSGPKRTEAQRGRQRKEQTTTGGLAVTWWLSLKYLPNPAEVRCG